MTDPERSPRWKAVAALIRQLRGQHAQSNMGSPSNALQDFEPERSAGTQSAGDDADLADPETGGVLR